MNGSLNHTIQKWKEREPGALRELWNRHHPLLEGLARRIASNDDLAGDVLQESLLIADRHIGELREVSSFMFWFRRILIRKTEELKTKERNRQQREILLQIEEEKDGTSLRKARDPLEELLLKEIKENFLSALDKLPERDARICRYRFLEGRTPSSIARIESIPLHSVKNILSRSRKLLRRDLRPLFSASHTLLGVAA